jgi:hypothetical protein
MEQIRLLTVRDLAEAIRPGAPEDEIVFVTRRIRHWTLAGALQTVGEVHSGVGRHRRYSTDAVYFAAILDALADGGLPLEALKLVAEQLRKWWAEVGDGRNGRGGLNYAIDGKGVAIYLCVEVRLSTGDPSRDWVRASLSDAKYLSEQLARKGRIPEQFVSMLNLTDVLKRVVVPEVT